MFCPRCGIDNKNGVNFCAGCGNALNAQQTGGGRQQKKSGAQPYGQLYTHQPTSGSAQPYGPEGYRNMGGGQPYGPSGSSIAARKDYLAANIVITALSVIACSPLTFILGIIGIVFANKANKAAAAGDAAGADAASNTSKIIFYISLAVLVIRLVFGYRKYIFMGKTAGKHFFRGLKI